MGVAIATTISRIAQFAVCLTISHYSKGIKLRFRAIFEKNTLLMQDFIRLFKEVPVIDAGLAASVFHFGEIAIPDLKKKLQENGITVRI